MKVDGIDPLVLNRVKDQATKSPLQETEHPNEQQSRIRQQQEQAKSQQEVLVDSEKGLLQEMEEAVRKLNDTADAMQLSLRFLVHKESERWMVQVIDILQDEIIREIPPEKVLNVVAQIQSLIGVLLDERR